MKFRLCLNILVLIAISLTSFAQSPESSEIQKNRIIAFVNVNVVPMDKERILSNQTVIIRNGLISEIGTSGKIKIPSDAYKIEGRGKYLVPGLVDAHVHLYSTTEMPLYIANGVTSVFDLNGRPAHLLWKKKIASGQLPGPTIYVCGPKFDRIRTPDEAVSEVERQFQAGYDGIKIYYQISKEEFPSLVAAAKRHNMIVVGHIARLPGFETTMKAGQSIAHAEEYLYSFFNQSPDPFKVKINLDESRIPEAVALTRAGGVSVIPTLVTYKNIVRQVVDLDEFLKQPEFKYLAPPQWDILQPSRNRYKNGFKPEEALELQKNFEFQKKLVKALHAAGVPIIAGTDSLGVGTVGGFSLHEELKIFVSLGLSPFEALKTATSGSAEFLKSSDKFGTVTVGKRADLLLLNGNPLEDIGNTSKLDGVMARGGWIPEPKLHQMLENLPNDYKAEMESTTRLLGNNPAAAILYLDENDPFGQLGGLILENFASQEGFEKLKNMLQQVKQKNPGSSLIKESTLNNLGYKLIGRKKINEAIEIFLINVELYPDSANVYDSLAEGYMINGDKELAIKNYKRSLELNPQNDGAIQYLKKLQP